LYQYFLITDWRSYDANIFRTSNTLARALRQQKFSFRECCININTWIQKLFVTITKLLSVNDTEAFYAHNFRERYSNANVETIIIIILINCNWVITRWQLLFYMYTNMEKKVTRKFKSGGLHERHVVATWKLGNHLSSRL
jgi:hypothetical protein